MRKKKINIRQKFMRSKTQFYIYPYYEPTEVGYYTTI